MAKHAHRLILNEKKTWRCTLPNCRYFIHIGLAHILPGQQSICWTCGDEFTLDERALQDDQPNCPSCRMESQGGPSAKEFEQMIERKLALAKAGVKDESELSDMQKNTMRALGLLPPLPEPPKQTSRKPARKLEGMPDEIEIDDPTE